MDKEVCRVCLERKVRKENKVSQSLVHQVRKVTSVLLEEKENEENRVTGA